jgi:hypothetical protein
VTSRIDRSFPGLAWALDRARAQTLALVADVPPEAMRLQAAPGERHPAWLLGHLLLADTYLLSLLDVAPLADDFPALLDRHGPGSAPDAHTAYDAKPQLVDRLTQVNALRVDRVAAMDVRDHARPLADAFLARAQPTIGHHLQSLVFHEGYHSGQLSSWRRAHGFGAVAWAMGPSPASGR